MGAFDLLLLLFKQLLLAVQTWEDYMSQTLTISNCNNVWHTTYMATLQPNV